MVQRRKVGADHDFDGVRDEFDHVENGMRACSLLRPELCRSGKRRAPPRVEIQRSYAEGQLVELAVTRHNGLWTFEPSGQTASGGRNQRERLVALCSSPGRSRGPSLRGRAGGLAVGDLGAPLSAESARLLLSTAVRGHRVHSTLGFPTTGTADISAVR